MQLEFKFWFSQSITGQCVSLASVCPPVQKHSRYELLQRVAPRRVCVYLRTQPRIFSVNLCSPKKIFEHHGALYNSAIHTEAD